MRMLLLSNPLYICIYIHHIHIKTNINLYVCALEYLQIGDCLQQSRKVRTIFIQSVPSFEEAKTCAHLLHYLCTKNLKATIKISSSGSRHLSLD